MLQGGDRDVDDGQVEDCRDDPDQDGERELDQRGIERLGAASTVIGFFRPPDGPRRVAGVVVSLLSCR
jgi:hypothetical protein